MKECINKKFILDGKVIDCEQFHPDLINKGISLYEVIRVIKGRLLFAEDHIIRLKNSASLACLDLWYTEEEILKKAYKLLRLNKITEGNIKIVFNFLNKVNNHFLAYFIPHRYPEKKDYETGVKVITFSFTREDPNKKIWRPVFRTAVNDAIHREKVYEVLLVDENNFVTEASRANFFTLRDRTVYTPPSNKVLPGVTRKYIRSICIKQNIPFREKNILLDELKEYDTAFLTGTSHGVLPIAEIDHLKFGVKDEVLRLLMLEFEKLVMEHLG